MNSSDDHYDGDRRTGDGVGSVGEARSSSFRELAAIDRELVMMAEAACGPLRDGLNAAGFDPR